MNILTDWKFWSMVVSAVALFMSIFVGIANRIITNKVTDKIQNNELKHITADILEIKEGRKELKIDLKNDLGKIFRRLGRIEKAQGIQRAICDERHGKIKRYGISKKRNSGKKK